jgi:hypothetical protein
VLRDSILAVTGKLNPERYGPPVPVARNSDSSVDTSDDAQGNRRSVYLIVRRSQHLTFLDQFDTPMMEVNCPERNVSTVPLQALALLNSPFSERNAAALADRILKAGANDEARMTYAWRLTFGRDPRPPEADKVRRFIAAATENNPNLKDLWTQIALVLMNSNEFLYAP